MTDDNLAREREHEELRRVLILTGGDDAPGLNAVLRAFVKTAIDLGMRVRAWTGLKTLIGCACMAPRTASPA